MGADTQTSAVKMELIQADRRAVSPIVNRKVNTNTSSSIASLCYGSLQPVQSSDPPKQRI